ncbi:DUF3137 domain-containing protein [Spiroplasma melliferum]|uniref:DUF3137 domain-containing protein n=2 Tax=Spiroplasma melliferum TaxID=2134 RepID=A0AAI9T2T6_SPIME|nr:DUF3137 domain-containing protein [Spiroplasma melliferum]KAI92191.1 hypothetical protein SPM_005490 [Spiroplasma melliferum KC3]QCO23605.1 hypothetical protein SRED_002076 [Spiroplasma melliferum]
MTSTALSESAINKIKALHQDHIQNHYRKITSFWRKSIIIDVIFSSLILFFTTALIIGIILTFIANNYDPALTFYLIYLPLPLLVITIILYMLIKAGAISISLFLDRLDYNEYYRIAIADLWKDEVILDEISNNFKIIPEPNFTSFSKNPKKNNLLQQSLIRVSSLEEKIDNKVINGTIKNNAFSLGVITVRKTMVFLKTLIFCLFIGLIVLASLSNNKSKDQKTSNSIANGINITYLLLWIEMKRSENYFFFTATLPKNLEIEANIVPHQGKFKKFILNNKEIELEGAEFPNLFDTNTTDPVKLRKILTPKAMANLIDNSNKYQEVLSMSFVNNKFTLLLDKYFYSKKAHHQNQIWKPIIARNRNIQNCIDDLIAKIELDLFHLKKGFDYLNGFAIK